MDDDRELEDPGLAAILRRHADELTGPVDTEAALRTVQQRARVRRRWRTATASIGAAAAALVIVVAGGAVLDREGSTVRTPAAPADGTASSATIAPTPPPASTPATPPPSVTTPSPVVTAAPPRSSVAPAPTSVPAGPPPVAPAPTNAAAPDPSTTVAAPLAPPDTDGHRAGAHQRELDVLERRRLDRGHVDRRRGRPRR